jgi:hypothetical protein
MVNNCTNINNMNNQLSPQITEHKMTMTYEIQFLAWGEHKHVARLNWLWMFYTTFITISIMLW